MTHPRANGKSPRAERAMEVLRPTASSEPDSLSDTDTVGNHHSSFRDTTISFAIDISGSTYGPTLAAEKTFIRRVSSFLSPQARFKSKVLPWDDKAHKILSLGQVGSLEDQGGTDPGVLLNSAAHKAALKESSLWFLMTDGLIPKEKRARFSCDIASHGLHGTSCVIVVFGNPDTGPASCDISVGIGVFSVVPDCAFLFCNEKNGDLRAMQTKGSFSSLLKGKPHPVFDSTSRWDSLPQVSVADFASLAVPTPQKLGPNQVALQDSLVIDMNDLFASRLTPDQINHIFSNVENLDTVRLTMQARNQHDHFHTWLQEQEIRPNDPLTRPREDKDSGAHYLFHELVDLVTRGQSPPLSLQSRLRGLYQDNMKRFISAAQNEIRQAGERNARIQNSINALDTPIDDGPSLTPTPAHEYNPRGRDIMPQTAVPTPDDTPCFDESYDAIILTTPQDFPAPAKRNPRQINPSRADPTQEPNEEQWGSWENGTTDTSLRGLLYSTGLRSTKGSFKGTCQLCGATGMTLAWLFRAPTHGPDVPPTPGGTAGFPEPGTRTRLAFPLAMGHFAETSGVLATSTTVSTPVFRDSSQRVPMLVCDPCSAFSTSTDAFPYQVTAALPMVRFSENREAVCRLLSAAFQGRFADSDLPQVFLSVLMLTADKMARARTPKPNPTWAPSPAPSETFFDIPATMAIAHAAVTFRAAVEWTAQDLLESAPALRTLSESFSPQRSPSQHPIWPLEAVLAGSFEEVDQSLDDEQGPPRSRAPIAVPTGRLRRHSEAGTSCRSHPRGAPTCNVQATALSVL